MRAPNRNWQELPDGSIKLIHHDLHVDAEMIIVPVEIRKPLSSSRVRLIMRHKETGVEAEWADSGKGMMVPRQLALSTAMNHAVTYRLHHGWLLRIGIDYYPEEKAWVREWEREKYRFGRP